MGRPGPFRDICSTVLLVQGIDSAPMLCTVVRGVINAYYSAPTGFCQWLIPTSIPDDPAIPPPHHHPPRSVHAGYPGVSVSRQLTSFQLWASSPYCLRIRSRWVLRYRTREGSIATIQATLTIYSSLLGLVLSSPCSAATIYILI